MRGLDGDPQDLGRCQRGRLGPPAKRLPGLKLGHGFESHPPRSSPDYERWQTVTALVSQGQF